MNFLKKLFDVSDYPARWNCGHWEIFEGWLHISSDLMIGTAYFLIPIILFICQKIANGELSKPVRRVVPYFIIFIFFCGSTHFCDAGMFYFPAYRFLGVLKFFTAIASWATVFILLFQAPKLISLQAKEDYDNVVFERDEAISERDLAIEAKQVVFETNQKIKKKISDIEKDLR